MIMINGVYVYKFGGITVKIVANSFSEAVRVAWGAKGVLA